MSLRKLIRLAIADDHIIFRKGLTTLLPRHNALIQIVGEAGNGEELIKEVERKKPDIVLTDIQMPVMSGADACRIIKEKFISVSVIACTMFSDADTIYNMYESGAKGYVTKEANIEEIAEAINTVHLGEMYYSPNSSTNLVKKIGLSKYNHFKKNSAIHFSEREIELIRLISFQLTTKVIAGKMKISTRTVEEYSRNVRLKIDARSNVGIALYALKNNIISSDEI